MDIEKIVMRFWDSTAIIMILGILASAIYRPFGAWLDKVFVTDWGVLIFAICAFGLSRIFTFIITWE